jgi:hypothetical protein
MNAKFLIAAAIALLGPASAFAQAAAAPRTATVQLAAAPVTREQVTAELYRARAAGEICGNEAECGQAPKRAAQAVTTASAGRNVHICQNEAECGAAPHRDFTVTRAQVLAELYRARAAGEIPETEADNDIGRAALRHRAN